MQRNSFAQNALLRCRCSHVCWPHQTELGPGIKRLRCTPSWARCWLQCLGSRCAYRFNSAGHVARLLLDLSGTLDPTLHSTSKKGHLLERGRAEAATSAKALVWNRSRFHNHVKQHAARALCETTSAPSAAWRPQRATPVQLQAVPGCISCFFPFPINSMLRQSLQPASLLAGRGRRQTARSACCGRQSPRSACPASCPPPLPLHLGQGEDRGQGRACHRSPTPYLPPPGWQKQAQCRADAGRNRGSRSRTSAYHHLNCLVECAKGPSQAHPCCRRPRTTCRPGRCGGRPARMSACARGWCPAQGRDGNGKVKKANTNGSTWVRAKRSQRPGKVPRDRAVGAASPAIGEEGRRQ